MVIIYALTMFVSATLLFMVQPMFTQMALPLLGGSPAVWNTSVVFFQTMLLAGYLYAHAATTWLGVRRQAALHVLLLLLPLLALPIGIPAGWLPPTQGNPIPWLLALLLIGVGLPFFVVSISSPMLQTWFAQLGRRGSADPYFLYAASNVGSMLALLGYPVLVEPYIGLRTQGWVWAGGYVLLVVLTLVCGLAVWRAPGGAARPHGQATPAAPAERLTLSRRARWILLACIPSSLMLSVTTYLTVDIAPIPLLWVIPLAIYLLTFILVFAGRPILPHTIMVRAFPIMLVPLLLVILIQATQPLELLILLHLLVLFVAAMVCHGELARDRPSPAHLTEFYVWLSVGGMLGGMFNALLAPILFKNVVEYPLVLALAGLALPAAPAVAGAARRHWLDLALPAALGALAIAAISGVQAAGLSGGPAALALAFGLPGLLCFSFSRRPLRFALGMGVLLLASTLYTGDQGHVLSAERSFFGIHRVLLEPSGRYVSLAHGSTRHGMQSREMARRREPLTYYHPSGPIGQAFRAFSGAQAKQRIAVIGLGAGSLTCYAQPGQRWTIYEIDPSVVHIARDSGYFSYLSACAPDAELVLGDARLSLARAPSHAYDLILLDAYSSHAIPIHLITQQALDLYLDKLAAGGVLAFHISNTYLDLTPVLGSLAQHAGIVAVSQLDLELRAEDQANGKSPSQWVLLARSSADLGSLANDPRWRVINTPSESARWTDDYSSVLSVFRW